MLSLFKNLTRHKKEQSSMRNPSSLEDYMSIADTIPGWVDRDELSYKAQITKKLPDNPVIVEIGCFRSFNCGHGWNTQINWKWHRIEI